MTMTTLTTFKRNNKRQTIATKRLAMRTMCRPSREKVEAAREKAVKKLDFALPVLYLCRVEGEGP